LEAAVEAAGQVKQSLLAENNAALVGEDISAGLGVVFDNDAAH